MIRCCTTTPRTIPMWFSISPLFYPITETNPKMPSRKTAIISNHDSYYTTNKYQSLLFAFPINCANDMASTIICCRSANKKSRLPIPVISHQTMMACMYDSDHPLTFLSFKSLPRAPTFPEITSISHFHPQFVSIFFNNIHTTIWSWTLFLYVTG